MKELERLSDDAQAWRHRSRRRFSVEQKAAIVRECLEPGATLSGVALEHGLNANMVRKWVVRHRAEVQAVMNCAKPAMIPVVMAPGPGKRSVACQARSRDLRIEIETGRGVMRVSGALDAPMLGALLATMIRG